MKNIWGPYEEHMKNIWETYEEHMRNIWRTCFVLFFGFGARLGLVLGGACACCVCLCVVVCFFYCNARLGFWDFNVVSILFVILCFGAHLDLVLGGVRVLCLLVRWCVLILLRAWDPGISMLFACFVLFFVFGARLGLVLGGGCACCVCLCVVVCFHCSARLGFCYFSVVSNLFVILFFGAGVFFLL